MKFMFFGATSFNQDLSSWNMSNVESMYFMFTEASSFNNDLSNWDVSKVTNMWRMFYDATSFNQNLCSWGDQLLTDASNGQMFNGARSCPTQVNPNRAATPPGPFCYTCD
jgi:surface protein